MEWELAIYHNFFFFFQLRWPYRLVLLCSVERRSGTGNRPSDILLVYFGCVLGMLKAGIPWNEISIGNE